jgi:hypothetical protein
VPNGLLLQNAAASDNADPACFPTEFSHYGRKTADRIYSPGYCPIGYTSADVAIDQPITTAVCCLSYVMFFPSLSFPSLLSPISLLHLWFDY